MPLLNFQKRFVYPIREGRKKHTIRGERKIPVKVGDKLHLYCGARTKNCFRILPEPPICTDVQVITIGYCGRCQGTGEVCYSSTNYGPCPVFQVHIDGNVLAPDECERLAVADGFSSFAEMMQFWDGRLPFAGHIIHWKETA